MVWLVSRRIEVVSRAICWKRLRDLDWRVANISSALTTIVMASSEYLVSSMSALIDYGIMDLKMELEKLKDTVDVIDIEGGILIGNSEGDLMFLRK